MATNPLFREGFYFFSNLYDDSLISEFYPKITQETWSAAMSSQKALATRGLRSSGDFNYFKGSMLDLVVNSTFNTRYGFADKTRSIKLTGFALPVRDERLLIRTYMKEEQQCMKIPQMDLLTRTDIFTKSLSVLFGDNLILNATFVIDSQRNVYLVLPYRYRSPVNDETTWSDADFTNIDSYLNTWHQEASELVTFKPHITLWVVPEDQDVVIKLSPSNSNKTYPLSRSTDYITITGSSALLVDVNTNESYSGFINSRDSKNGDITDIWEIYIMDGFGGNMFHSITTSIYSMSYYSDGNMKGSFKIEYSDYFNNLRTGGSYPGYYCYLMRRGNKNQRSRQTISNPLVTDAMIKDLLPQNSANNENPPSPFNLRVYAYDVANDHKLYRLDSAALEPICFEAVYDFSDINPDNEPLRIEIDKYLTSDTNQAMHNSMRNEQDNEVRYGISFSAALLRGADVAQEGDPSPGRNFSPQSQLASYDDYVASDYRQGDDFRGYFLDKIIETIKTDPGLTKDYFDFIASKDPVVYSTSGTPRDFGFNTGLSGSPTYAYGTNPIVNSTEGYMEHSSADNYIIPIADDDGFALVDDTSGCIIVDEHEYKPITFSEPHSFIKINSNNEKVYAKFFLVGVQLVPTVQTFNGVDNFFFFPVASIRSRILHVLSRAGNNTNLALLKPLTVDVYPHSFTSYEEALKETNTIPVSSQTFTLFSNQKTRNYIRLLDLSYTISGDRHANILDDFDVYLTVNVYRVQTPDGYRYFKLRSDQALDGILPLIEGLYPGSSIKKYSTEDISLSDTIDDMLDLNLITEDETYKLLCKSLPIKDLKFKAKANSPHIGETCTWQMENYTAELEFTGDDIITYPGQQSNVGYKTWNSSELTGIINKPHLGDFINGAERWILYKNGRLEPNFKIRCDDNGNEYDLTVHISSMTPLKPGSSYSFNLIHLPAPVSIDRGEYASTVSFMRQQKITRTSNPMTVYQLWPTGMTPSSTGFIVLDRILEDSQAPVGSNANDIYLDNYHSSTGGGARLNRPNLSTYADRGAFYRPIDAAETTANGPYPPSIVRTINGLPIITGQEIQISSPFNFYIGPEKNELVEVVLNMNHAYDLHTVRYLNNGFIATGLFLGGYVMHYSPENQINSGQFYPMLLPSETIDDFAHLRWTIIGYINNQFFAVSENPRNYGPSYQTIFATSTDGYNWTFRDPRSGSSNYNPPILGAGSNFDTFGFYGSAMCLGSTRAPTSAYSSNGIIWYQAAVDRINKTVIIGLRNGTFVAVNGHNVNIGRNTSYGFMWESVYSIPSDVPIINLVDKEDLIHGFTVDHSHLFTSVDGRWWGMVELDPEIDHLDDRFIVTDDFDFSIAMQGVRTPRLRYAKLNIEQNMWYLELPEKYFIDRYVSNYEGYLDIANGRRHYPGPIMSGQVENGIASFNLKFIRNYTRP